MTRPLREFCLLRESRYVGAKDIKKPLPQSFPRLSGDMDEQQHVRDAAGGALNLANHGTGQTSPPHPWPLIVTYGRLVSMPGEFD